VPSGPRYDPPALGEEADGDWVGGTAPVGVTARRRRVMTMEEAAAHGWHPDHRRGGRHWGRWLLLTAGLVIIGLIVAAVAIVMWVSGHLSGGGGAEVDLTLPDGAGHGALATTLSHAGVISDSWLFHHYLDYRGVAPANGGPYVFHAHEGYRAALHDLGQGPRIVQERLTIPEGYDLTQIADAVGKLPGRSAARFLELARSGAVRSKYEPADINSLEGLVFPDTYFIDPAEDEQAILQRMVDRFDQVAASVGLDTSVQTTGLTPYQTLVVASLIEKEAKLDVDRPMIARVILNRLKDKMRLQIDATVLYAEGVHKDRILNSDLATNSPYNTYRVAGLPPGPIASPGRASLAAALNPTPGTWLYYVLIDPSGKHAFATTSSEFERLKAEAHAKGLL